MGDGGGVRAARSAEVRASLETAVVVGGLAHRRVADSGHNELEWRFAMVSELLQSRPGEQMWMCRPDKNAGSSHMGAGKFDPVNHVVPFFTPIPTLAYDPAALCLEWTLAAYLVRADQGGKCLRVAL